MKKVTLADMERITGCSKSTISRVVTGRGYVEATKKRRIEQAIQAAGYQYVPAVKRPAADMRDLVMVTSALLNSEVHITIVEGVISTLHAANKRAAIMYNAFTSSDMTESYLRYAKERNFAGVIMLGALETPSMLDTLDNLRLPVVLLNQNLRGLDVDVVDMDDYRGAYMAMQKLLSCGHMHVGFLGGYPNTTTMIKRENGYRDALKDAKLPFKKQYIYNGNFREDSGYAFARQVVREMPEITAVVSCNDLMSIGFVRGMQTANVRIPADMSVITFDNTFFTRNLNVCLTAIDYDFAGMGVAAADMLLARVKNPEKGQRRITFSPQLVEGESVRDLY